MAAKNPARMFAGLFRGVKPYLINMEVTKIYHDLSLSN